MKFILPQELSIPCTVLHLSILCRRNLVAFLDLSSVFNWIYMNFFLIYLLTHFVNVNWKTNLFNPEDI